MAAKEDDLDEVMYVRLTSAEKRKIERTAQKKGLRHAVEYVRQAIRSALERDA
jgi:hypothetical protein